MYDEVDSFGYYLEHCKLIEESDFKDLDSFFLNKYSSKIDEFMDGKGDKSKIKLHIITVGKISGYGRN
ncbi:hypothetical protein [Chishuiella sp.]|uniref:hypothetical protein n=1 Tax=Chishuiella sp. TaxID=1969467 RepID=UPI0028ACC3A8|nr:hypothetical protein [Chishuiella sp.]